MGLGLFLKGDDSLFAGSYAVRLLDGDYENFSVADFARVGGFHYCLDNFVCHVGRHAYIKDDFGEEFGCVFAASVYLGMSLLGMVPVIGLVFLLVWALDSPGRPNRRNFARGFLAARVIAWAVFFVLTFVLFLIMAVASPAFYY